MNKEFRDLMALHFLNDGVRTTFIVILPFIAKDLALNFKTVGLLGSAQPLIASLLALPAGFIATKFGAFRSLLAVLAIYSLGAFFVGISPNAILVIAAFFLGALGFGMFHTISFALVAKISEKTNVGSNLGNFTGVGDIGRILVPPAAVFIASKSSWRASMLILAIIGFATYFTIRFLQRIKNNQPIEDKGLIIENYQEFFRKSLKLFKEKNIVLTITAGVMDSVASSPIYIFLPFLLLSKKVTGLELSVLIAAYFIGSFAGKVLLGRGVDKFGNRKVFIASEISMAAVVILIAFLNPLILLLVLAFILGIFTKGTSPVVNSMFSNLIEKEHYNKIYALSELLIGAGAMVAILVMGAVSDKFGIKMVFYLSSILVILATFPIFLVGNLNNSR